MGRALLLLSLVFPLLNFSSGAGFLWSIPLDYLHIDPSRDFTGQPLPTYQEYLDRFSLREFRINDLVRFPLSQPLLRRDHPGRVMVVVNTQLYERLEGSFHSFIRDLGDEGYDVILASVEGGTPDELKGFIREQLGDDGEGVILFGELPLAWFENYEHFYDEHRPDRPVMVEYPIDLYFMDLDGEWSDTSGNGVFDQHVGSWEPDIWLGRVAAYNLFRVREDTLIASYLERLSRYRRGELALPHQGLAFIDDDWIPWSERWRDYLGLAWGLTHLVADPESTSAATYRSYLSHWECEVVQVAVHSTSDSHGFFIDNHSRYDYFRYRHLRDEVIPRAFFYNLFACSVMNLARDLALGPLYALKGPYGLGAVGPTKVGGMLFYEDFYRPLGEGYPIGEAFRRWMVQHARDPEHPNWSRSWFYGMTYFGDPTLRIPLGIKVETTRVDDAIGGDGDSILDAGEQGHLYLSLVNHNQNVIRDVVLHLLTPDSSLFIADDSFWVGDMRPGQIAQVMGIPVLPHYTTPDAHNYLVLALFSHREGYPWGDRFRLEVRAPKGEFTSLEWGVITGDGDSLWEEGEVGQLRLKLKNRGGDRFMGARVNITSLTNGITIDSSRLVLPSINPQAELWTPYVRFSIADDEGLGGGLFFRVEVEDTRGVLRGDGISFIPQSGRTLFEEAFHQPPVWMRSYAVKEGYADGWRWGEDAGEGEGGVALGGPDTLTYPPQCDAALELPLMTVPGSTLFVIKHSMQAEPEYDGGIVEVDWGEGWERLTPEGGYPGYAVNNGSFPGGECWNGTFDWRVDRLPLGEREGSVRLRLRFGSDEGLEMRGWFIDRVKLEVIPQSVSSPPLFSHLQPVFELYPNPVNAVLQIKLKIGGPFYAVVRDIQGRIVARKTTPHLPYERISYGTSSPPTLTWDLSYLPAGVYYLSVQMGGQIQTKKFVLLR